ncbi:MAG: GspE/PulE family protein [Candidatus Magasanikbacteria bacterium]
MIDENKEQLEDFLNEQKKEAEKRAAKKRAKKLGFDYIDLVSTKAPTEIEAMKQVDKEKAKEALMVPIQIQGDKLIVATYNPEKKKTQKVLNELKKDFDLKVTIASLSGLKHTWSFYDYVKKEEEEITGEVNINAKRVNRIKESVDSLNDLTEKIENFESPKVSQILEVIIAGAMSLGASDIHLEPEDQNGTLRLRIDGIMHVITEKLKPKILNSLISRIKLLSGLKLNVEDEPQDGRFTMDMPEKDVEIRSSTVPSEYGEGAVLRLLDPESIQVGLENLGFREDSIKEVRKQIQKPNGLILNTGPTGSGKTTTLYSFLRELNDPEVKIITIEDPIEYHVEGISQTQVDRSSGYTFAKGLRSIVRQDPDIILVGEIRDEETAGIALNASLTGHMVFSTLHTNDAVGAIPRMLDLGAEPNILAPGATFVIAQRLLRVLCPECKEKTKLDKETKNKIDRFLDNLPQKINKEKFKNKKVFKAKGCEKCNNIGYEGRTGIFELFEITKEIEEMIYEDPTELELKEKAKEEGMVEMQEDGILKVLKGETTFEEVSRLTGEIEWLPKSIQ